MKFQKYAWTVLLLSLAQAGYGQRTLEEQINVVRAYRPILAEAVKIRRHPQLSDTGQAPRRLSYLVTDQKLGDNSNPGPVPAKSPASIADQYVPYFYGKAGAGNFGSLLAEAYFNSKEDENKQYGLFFQHNSAQGDFEHQQYNRTGLGGFAKFNLGERANLNLNASYRQRGNQFYAGGSPVLADPGAFPDSLAARQRFNLVQGEAEIASLRSASAEWVYGLKLGGYSLSDEFESGENNFYLSALIGKQMGTFSLNLAGGIDATRLESLSPGASETATLQNSIFRFQPYIHFQTDQVTFKGGINLVSIGDEAAIPGIDKTLFIFPEASIDFQLIENTLALFGGVTGDIKRHSMKEFSEENAYMRHFGSLSNSREKYKAFAGLRGSFSSSVGFRAQFEYANVDNQNFLVNDTVQAYEFAVYQAAQNGKRTVLNAELNFRYSEAFRLNMGVWSYSYEDDFIQRAWNVPTLKFYASPTYNYRDKLFLTADLFYVGERNAYLGQNEEGVRYQALDAFTDLSFGATYKINQNFGIFLKANNVLNKEYERYLYYPQFGFNMMGGLTFTF